MADRNTIAGYALFAVLVILAAAAAGIALGITGEKEIEERFLYAVGPGEKDGMSGTSGAAEVQHHGADEVHDQEKQEPHPHEGGSGFFLEGSAIMYLSVLALLVVVSVLAYRRFGFS